MPAGAQQWGTLEYGAFGSNNSFTNAVQWGSVGGGGMRMGGRLTKRA